MAWYTRNGSQNKYNPWVEILCWKPALKQGCPQYGPQGNRDNYTDQPVVGLLSRHTYSHLIKASFISEDQIVLKFTQGLRAWVSLRPRLLAVNFRSVVEYPLAATSPTPPSSLVCSMVSVHSMREKIALLPLSTGLQPQRWSIEVGHRPDLRWIH
jgi:hypothetical protein